MSFSVPTSPQKVPGQVYQMGPAYIKAMREEIKARGERIKKLNIDELIKKTASPVTKRFCRSAGISAGSKRALTKYKHGSGASLMEVVVFFVGPTKTKLQS